MNAELPAKPTPPAIERRLSRIPPIDTLDDAALALGMLDARLTELEAELAVEKRERREEMQALRQEWKNIATGIAAHGVALGNATAKLSTELTDIKNELAEIRVDADFVKEQMRLLGRGMDLLLQDAGLSAVVNPHE